VLPDRPLIAAKNALWLWARGRQLLGGGEN
jgi:hypothetical protein